MTKTNKTRSALFMSVISMLLCVSMLVGTTFAWFTDEAKSGMNQIIAGNLDVELLYKDGDAYKNAANVKLFDDIDLWEPGMVVYETVKIANVGNLALKYALSINTGNENKLNGHGLSEVLHFAVIDGEIGNKTRAEVLALAEASANKGMLTTYTFGSGKMLNANTESAPMTLVVYWPASTNEFDNLFNANNGQKTSDGAPLHIDLGLTVLASQETVEKDSFNEFYDDTAGYPENMWLGDVAEALVIDEDNKTISISSGAELAKLAAEVNGGNTFKDYTVKLTDSIDLGNIAWTPIGGQKIGVNAEGKDIRSTFSGVFDGDGKTIYNLNTSDPYAAGLFGSATSGTIKNLNIVNAKVASNHYAAAISAHGLCTKVENCSVKNAVITTAAEQLADGTWDNGDKAGAIVGYLSAEPTAYVKNCVVTNAKITGYRDIGGVVGYAGGSAEVVGNTVTDAEIVCDWVHNYNNYEPADDFDLGEIVGHGTAGANNTATNVTIMIPDKIVEGTTIALYEPEVYNEGGTIYINSASDLAYLNELATKWLASYCPPGGSNGYNSGSPYYWQGDWDIVLNCDLDLANAPWTPVDMSKFGNFDGQGHTISNLNVNAADGFAGLFSTAHSVSNLNIVNANVIGKNAGALAGYTVGEIKNVHVTNADVVGTSYAGGLSGTAYASIIDSSVINSSVTGNRKDVGGLVGFNNETRIISGNTVNSVMLAIDSAESVHNIGALIGRWNFPQNNGASTVENNSTNTVYPLIGAASNGYIPMAVDANGNKLAASAEALTEALTDGGNVMLDGDVFVDKKLEVASGKEVVLDLNGNELSGAFTQKGVSALIQNKGTLTIKNGTVVSMATNPDTDWNPEGFPTYASNTISNTGVLVIGEGAVIENQTNVGGASYAIDNYAGATLTVNDGAVIKAKDVAIRINTASTSAANNVTINGGEITGKRAIWIHIAGSNAAQAPEVNLTINGGDFNSTSDWTIYSYSYGQSFANVNVTINGGDFEKNVAFGGGTAGAAKTTQETVTVTGGTFNGDLGRYLVNDGWEDIAKP